MGHVKILNVIIVSIMEAEAIFYKMKQKFFRKKIKGKIKVIFMCQYIPAWNKVRQLYETLKNDDRFEVTMLCIPSDINRAATSGRENEIWRYFADQGYDTLDALGENGEWLDLKSLQPDYIFYQRPYNAYLPKQYHTRNVAKYAKINYISYGVAYEGMGFINRDFFRNVYYYFAETECVRDLCIRKFKPTHLLGLRKTVFLGMPAVLDIMKAKNRGIGSWEFSQNDFRVIWTSRWTSDLKLGGTNFLDYYKPFIAYAEENKEMDFLFRPHPLTFENFLRTGEMTEQEISDFKDKCQSLSNVKLDDVEEYAETFWQADVLVCDISGIMPDFFITGKPLIFCASNMVLELNEFMLRMCEGCYIANSIEEVFMYVEDIKNGKDVLAEKRRELREELFGVDLEQIPNRIMEEIVNDSK